MRAVAILGVLAFHLEFPWFSLGWAGVPLFFVLSGFLITGILLDAKGSPGYLRNFYGRRALRILPIYYLTLFAVAMVTVALGQTIADWPFYLLYAQNYLLGATNFSARFPFALNHSWSLAIEEQFYLLWPLAVLWLGRRKLLWLTGARFAAGPASRGVLLLATHNPTLMDASLFGQLDSLAAGAGLALLARSGLTRRSLSRIAWWVLAVSAVVVAVLIRYNGLDAYWHPQTWALELHNLATLSLMALAFASVICLVMTGAPVLSSLFRLGPLRHVGRISYGLYMCHFPVFVAVDKLLWQAFPDASGPISNLAHLTAKVGLTYLIALASWRLVETPLLRLKARFTTPS